MIGKWSYSLDHREPCRIVETEELWGQTTCLVWLPRRSAVVRVLLARLTHLSSNDTTLLSQFSFVAAASQIEEALERDALVSPLEGTVIPLPHQLHALQRAMSKSGVRYLLADEVGLGKTIEAGLILRELKLRGLVRRVLVVAPTGLVTQWVSEMKTHFHEDFRLVLPNTFSLLRQNTNSDEPENLWRRYDQVVCPLDSVKPLESRRGWSYEQLTRYNHERFEELVTAGWDLIIIDEAHRLGGSTEQVARFKLGEGLSQASPYLLLLSATPHQGKSDSFRRLIGFLEANALPPDEEIKRDRVAPYVIRTEKRRAIDAEGNPLFLPRVTKLIPIAWNESGADQRALYEAVTEYVRDGYNRALQEKKNAVGFLMILMQRLVTSSNAAIRAALERRLEVLSLPESQLSLFTDDLSETWSELDGQEQLEELSKAKLKGLKDERKEVELLLSMARRCEAQGPDVKAQALLSLIQQLQREENEPSLKVLVFTEFVPTQEMLQNFLEQRGFPVVCLNGSLNFEERRIVQQRFAGDAQVLISTDAGGEGLNLQFCHVVVNYDLPWNPMKLEQRIGRVDRIGQKHVVRALNFALEDTVELRVREVLEEKLQKILTEFGVDKLSDVLDSEEGGVPFEALFVQAVIAPQKAEQRTVTLAEEIRQRLEAAKESAAVLSPVEQLDPQAAQKISGHQLPYWIERMTLSYLQTKEGSFAKPDAVGYSLRWPDGYEQRRAVFRREDAEASEVVQLSLEDERIRNLTKQLPLFAPGQPVPVLVIPGVSERVSGVWSLWRISLHAASHREQRFLSLFINENGRVLNPTARLIWDKLIELPEGLHAESDLITGENTSALYNSSRTAAELQGASIFQEMLEAHRTNLQREKEKGELAFKSRRRMIGRLGLAQVKMHRYAKLNEEELAWQTSMKERETALPELTALLLVQLKKTL